VKSRNQHRIARSIAMITMAATAPSLIARARTIAQCPPSLVPSDSESSIGQAFLAAVSNLIDTNSNGLALSDASTTGQGFATALQVRTWILWSSWGGTTWLRKMRWTGDIYQTCRSRYATTLRRMNDFTSPATGKICPSQFVTCRNPSHQSPICRSKHPSNILR